MVILDAVARRYGQRPWDLVCSSWLGYQFDVAVSLVALDVEGEQEPQAPHRPASSTGTRPGKSRPAPRVTAPVGKEGYSDPTALTSYAGIGIKTMKIPEDGIW